MSWGGGIKNWEMILTKSIVVHKNVAFYNSYNGPYLIRYLINGFSLAWSIALLKQTLLNLEKSIVTVSSTQLSFTTAQTAEFKIILVTSSWLWKLRTPVIASGWLKLKRTMVWNSKVKLIESMSHHFVVYKSGPMDICLVSNKIKFK